MGRKQISISTYNLTLDTQQNLSKKHLMYEERQFTFQVNNIEHLEWRLAI